MLPREYANLVRQSLRYDAPPIVLGLLIFFAAIVALLFYRQQQQKRVAQDRSLLWLGVFALLFSVRILLSSDIVPFTLDLPRITARYAVAAITYVIVIPALLLLRELFPAWRRTLRYLLYAQIAFAGAGLASDAITRQPKSLDALNSVLALLGGVFLILALFRQNSSPEIRLTRWGLGAFFAAAIATNVAALAHHPFPIDPEPFGFALWIASLAMLSVRRSLRNEESLRAIRQELETARRIQAFLLPKTLPQTDALQIAARYVPMAEVAGDFYDILAVDPQHIGILVADVSGHGVPAALIASMVKIAAQLQISCADDPAQVLANINAALAGKVKGQFVTAAYVYVDLLQSKIRYASAGHPPMLVIDHGGNAVTAWPQRGLALGLRSKSQYVTAEQTVPQAGMRLCLYTDGITEAHDPAGEMFGEDRLRASLRECRSTSPDECADALLADVTRWCAVNEGRPYEDDLTLLLIDVQRLPAAL